MLKDSLTLSEELYELSLGLARLSRNFYGHRFYWSLLRQVRNLLSDELLPKQRFRDYGLIVVRTRSERKTLRKLSPPILIQGKLAIYKGRSYYLYLRG